MRSISLLWGYKDFIVGNIKREIQIRHSNTFLGMGWLVIHPLIMIAIYTTIFSRVMSGRISGIENIYAYSIFICIGIIHWTFFSDLTGRLVNIFLSNANLIKKINFPKLVLPIIALGSALVSYAIMITIFTIFLILSGNFPGLVYLAFIPVLMVQILFSMGLGLYLGIFNIFFRDVSQIYNVAIQIWFWATPIVYPIAVLPDYVKKYIFLNPMAVIFQAYQSIFIYKAMPEPLDLSIVAALSILLCMGAVSLLRNRMSEIIDEL